MAQKAYRVPAKPAAEEPAPRDRDSVVSFVKHTLRNSLYESGDFEVTDDYISIDLAYDSKSYVEFYQGAIAERYPEDTRLDGTRVTVYYGDDNGTGQGGQKGRRGQEGQEGS